MTADMRATGLYLMRLFIPVFWGMGMIVPSDSWKWWQGEVKQSSGDPCQLALTTAPGMPLGQWMYAMPWGFLLALIKHF